MINPVSKVTIDNLIGAIDRSNLHYLVKRINATCVFERYSNGQEITVSNDILKMTYRDFINRDRTTDDSNTDSIEKVLTSGQYNLRKFMWGCLSIPPFSNMKSKSIYTPHCSVMSLKASDGSSNQYLFDIPAKNIMLDIPDGYHSMDTSIFNNVVDAIDYYVDDQKEFVKQWITFKEEDDLSIFGVDAYPTLNDDIATLIDIKYKNVKYRHTSDGHTSVLRIGSTEHLIIESPETNCTYKLYISIGYAEAIRGSMYIEYACVSKMAQYLFFANQLNQEQENV